MLHLTNGEATAAGLRAAGVDGSVVSVDDILMEGPLRNGLATAGDWLHRARWLEERLGIPKADYLANHARRERAVRTAREGSDEVVVWSEEDLFCQVNLAHLLTRLADVPRSRLRLVAPAQERIGPLPPERLRELLEARRPVPEARFALAARTWRALADDDPRGLEPLARGRDPAWPALADGVRLHLARFPHVRTGVGAPEHALLRALAPQPRAFAPLFDALRKDETWHAYGMGDAQALALLRRMARAPEPLVFADDPRATEDPNSPGVWAATPLGAAVAEGRERAPPPTGADDWLGGVRLDAEPGWAWDADAGRLVPTQGRA